MHPPPHELAHSPAARRVAAHARASGLFFSHFEHHVDLDGPEAWSPAARPDLGERAGWRGGVLPEAKFRHFRLDRMVASFHPAHGPKWTVHELCHRLVGWAWHPGASPLFVATAARLAELAPVALWYFYDEIGARRCARHAGSDPRFDLRCAACEGLPGVDDGAPREDSLRDDRLREEGDRYVAAELAAVAETVRLGRPVSHRWTTLELTTDGLAWAAAHGRRLASPAFHGWVERFVPPETGRHTTLEALTERVSTVIAALRDGAPLTAWKADRRRWIAQDVGWRLTTIHADCEGDAARTLDGIVTTLADDLDVAAALEAYGALAAAFELPEPEDAFAVGYDLPGGLGRSARQIGEGLDTVCPGALALLGDAAPGVVGSFTAVDVAVRAPLGRRFAEHLVARAAPGDAAVTNAAELATLEAAVVHAPPMDPAVATLREGAALDGPVRLAPGVAVVRSTRDWRRWLGGKPPAGRQAPRRALTLAVVREPDGEVALWELDAAVAAVGDTPEVPDVPADERAALLAAGVWMPEGWVG